MKVLELAGSKVTKLKCLRDYWNCPNTAGVFCHADRLGDPIFYIVRREHAPTKIPDLVPRIASQRKLEANEA